MLSAWDKSEIVAARLNERRARADIEDLRQTIDETRRVIAASRKLLDRLAEDHPAILSVSSSCRPTKAR